MRAVQAHPAGSFVHISWSLDGRLLVSGGNDDQVIVWDANALEPLHTFSHSDMALSYFTSFSPDGRWLMVSAGRHFDKAGGGYGLSDVSGWDLENNTRLTVFSDCYQVLVAAWNAEGNLLAYLDTTHEPLIRFWAVPAGGAVAPEPITIPPFDVGQLRWQPDGTLTAVGVGKDGFVQWNAIEPDRLTLSSGTTYPGLVLAYSPDGSLAASVSATRSSSPETGAELSIFVWDTATGNLRYTLPYPNYSGLSGLAFSPDNALLATGREYEVRVWDLASGSVAATLPSQSSSIDQLAFSPDGKTLAASEQSGTIRLWRFDAYLHPAVTATPVPTLAPIAISKVAPVFLTSLAVPSVIADEPGRLNTLRWLDENTLHFITDPYSFDEAAGKQRITHYDLMQGRTIDSYLVEIVPAEISGIVYASPIYSPDGSKFASWMRHDISNQEDDTVGVYDAATNALLLEIPADQISRGSEIAWAPDGSRIAVQTFPAIEVFAVPSGVHIMTLENVLEERQPEQYEKVIWSPDGAWIASYWQGPKIGDRFAAWDATTGSVVHEYGGVRHLAFSPDGSRLLLVGPERAILLDLSTGEVQTIPAIAERMVFGENVSWSPDGVYVALDCLEKLPGAAPSVLIWSTKTGSQTILHQLHGEIEHRQGIRQGVPGNLVWSPVRPWFALVDQGVVYILDPGKREVIRLDPAVTLNAEKLVWSPDGSRVAIVGSDAIVEIWEFFE